MPQENVELVHKAVEYWNRGDLDAFMDVFAEDAVLRADENWPERVYYGKDALRSFYALRRRWAATPWSRI